MEHTSPDARNPQNFGPAFSTRIHKKSLENIGRRSAENLGRWSDASGTSVIVTEVTVLVGFPTIVGKTSVAETDVLENIVGQMETSSVSGKTDTLEVSKSYDVYDLGAVVAVSVAVAAAMAAMKRTSDIIFSGELIQVVDYIINEFKIQFYSILF